MGHTLEKVQFNSDIYRMATQLMIDCEHDIYLTTSFSEQTQNTVINHDSSNLEVMVNANASRHPRPQTIPNDFSI